MLDLKDAPIGTPHPKATCCWCGSALVVGQVLALRCWLCPVDYRRQTKHALIVQAQGIAHAKLLGVARGEQVCLDVPLPSQVAFEDCQSRYVLWGGHAGPGKSHGVRKWLYRRSLSIPNHEALLLRENWEQLEKTHIRAMEREMRLLGGEFSNRTGRMPNGSVIDCGHMADADAVARYLSTEYGAIVAEEGSVYPVDSEGTTPLAELSTRARKAYRDVAGQLVDPRFIVPTNPGGPSSHWLTQNFVDHLPDYDKFPRLKPVYDEQGHQTSGYRQEQWAYIPAKLTDNPYMRDDYAETDLAVLTGVRYQQLAEGDWHVFSGQFFRKWHKASHMADLGTPSGGQWFRSMDWGYNAPGCVLWWAVLPDHRVYVRAEMKFQQMDEPDVVAAVREVEMELGRPKIAYTAGDPAVFNETGATHRHQGFVGKSIGETLGYYGMPITRADHDRINGWKRCHSLLGNAPDGTPWLVVHPDCTYLIRTIAGARSDKNNPDDVDTKSDDHALDAWRYGAMSRPSPAMYQPVVNIPHGSPAWHMQRLRQKQGRPWGKVA